MDNISYFGSQNTKINELISLLDSYIYKGYIGFPHYKYAGQLINIDAVFITKIGVLAIIDSRQNNVSPDDVYSKIEITLKNDRELLRKRNLICDIKVLSISFKTNIDNEEFASVKELYDYYMENELPILEDNVLRRIVHNIEGGLDKQKKSRLETETTKVLTILETNLSTYDKSQLDCLSDKSEKIQAISGLAGSGKTVILSKKISEILLNDDNKNVCVTFYSRSLKPQMRNMIKQFLDKQSDISDKLMERVSIMNSWGNASGDGIYSMICKKIQYDSIPLYKAKLYNRDNPFEYCCKNLYEHMIEEQSVINMYDYIFIDEAQDLNEYFLKICYKALNENGKLIYAYDEFQDLDDKTMKSPEEIFGINDCVTTPLEICYRTPKEILISAHSVGMGLNSKLGICQFFEKKETWNVIGYNLIEESDHVIADRKTSPIFEKIENENFIEYHEYEDIDELECNLANYIEQDLNEGYLKDDLMIVDIAKWETFDNFLLFKKYSNDRFKTSLAGEINPNVFFEKDRIMYSYVHRAKGNEAYKVYIVNAQLAMNKYFRDTWRNRLFTAMTRSKWKVVLLSIKGDESLELKQELDLVKENGYKLIFKYPTPEDIAKVKHVAKQNIKTQKAIEDASKGIHELKDLDSNERAIHIRDLLLENVDKDTLDKIKELLNKHE